MSGVVGASILTDPGRWVRRVALQAGPQRVFCMPIQHKLVSMIAALQPTRTDPFAALNAEQRQAVLHGCDAGTDGPPPLLIIAGAGSGKTLTLAARVARLVLDGADPQRILLLS